MTYRKTYNPSFGELGSEIAQRWPERKIIEKKGKDIDTLGLALSGGGYRSAIFNYGILKGLHKLGVLERIDYLSVVSGGSWIGAPFATTETKKDGFKWFFHDIEDHSNLIEEGFESLLVNPMRVAYEAALARKTQNYVSNIFGRLLAKNFLRELGQEGRYKGLAEASIVRDDDRPFLIINGTINYRSPNSFSVTQECFEMTRLYAGCRSLGYVHAKDLAATKKPIRLRDAIAISGAAVALHLPALGDEVAGFGLSREVKNYAKQSSNTAAKVCDADHLDVSDGGHYNNLGIESLINRGCGYIIVVDAEHDPESKNSDGQNQRFSGLRTLLKRHHIPNPIGEPTLELLDRVDEPVHVIDGNETIPDILYIKLKSNSRFNEAAKKEEYNQSGFLTNLFGRGEFAFDPQYSTAKLDYDFAEHRNLSKLGEFIVKDKANMINKFVSRSK